MGIELTTEEAGKCYDGFMEIMDGYDKHKDFENYVAWFKKILIFLAEAKKQLPHEEIKTKRRLIFKGTQKELFQIAKEQGMFELEILDTIEEVRKCVREDEGNSIQQIHYSSYHDALTQINFTKKIIRTNKNLNEVEK